MHNITHILLHGTATQLDRPDTVTYAISYCICMCVTNKADAAADVIIFI